MATPAIDLRRRLEALFYLDSRYFDNGANELKDRSGRGRHATASGGPSVGVNGPRAYKATSFDGSDDYFDINEGADSTERTVAVLAKWNWPALPDDQMTTNILATAANYELYLRKSDNNKPMVRYQDNDGNTASNFDPDTEIQNAWAWYFGRTDGEIIECIINNFADHSTAATTNGGEAHSTISEASDTFEGDIAFVGDWSRLLTRAELEYLVRSTGPQRAIV